MKILTLSTLLLCAASLSAADFTGGVQLGPAFPQGDMKALTDGSTGAQVVFFGRWDLGGGHAIRARLDGTSASGTPDAFKTPFGTISNGPAVKVTSSTSSFGADYLYYLEGNTNRGFYLGGGLGFGNNHVELELPLLGGYYNSSSSASSATYGLYAGYQFSPHWSMELTYHGSRFKKDFSVFNSTATATYTMPSVALVAGYTF